MLQNVLVYTTLLSSLAALTLARSHTQTIWVGMGGSSSFIPSTITAEPGDLIEFVFDSKKHSVVRGAFMDGCNPFLGTGGFYSGKQKQVSESKSLARGKSKKRNKQTRNTKEGCGTNWKGSGRALKFIMNSEKKSLKKLTCRV